MNVRIALRSARSVTNEALDAPDRRPRHRARQRLRRQRRLGCEHEGRLQPRLPRPRVLQAPGGKFYAYPTQSGSTNVPVQRTGDFRKWQSRRDAMPTLAPWVQAGHTWAPGVIKVGSSWLLYYTARLKDAGTTQCIGLAVSTSPLGPFTDRSTSPFVCQRDQYGSIDASPFRAGDGKLYLHWKSDNNAAGQQTHLWGQELRSDGRALLGTPVRCSPPTPPRGSTR